MVTSSAPSHAAGAARPSLLRRLRFPLIAAVLFCLPLAVFPVWERFDLDPTPLMPIMQAGTLLQLLVLLAVPVWFWFFSGFAGTTKLGVTALFAVLAVGAIASIRKVEFTAMFQPIPEYRWEPDPEDELERSRNAASESGNRPSTTADLTVGAADFPRYRGRDDDGVAHGFSPATDWDARAPKVLWRQPAGGGYASFAVAGDSAVTIEQRRDQEAVVCYDRQTGRERWVYAYYARFKQSEPMGGDGPRATPTIADGDVYSLGAEGHLVCLDGATGQPRWATNILADNSARNVAWGMTGSPLVTGNLVVVNPGINPDQNAENAVAAYDRKTGKRVWAAGKYGAGYSSPKLARLAGMDQILLFDAGGLAGMDPADGRELWRYPWTTFSDMNIIQPLVLAGDRVFISSELANGAALVQVKRAGDGWTTDTVWKSRHLCAKFSNPVLHGDHIYGLHSGTLVCLDARTGARQWKGERFGIGQLVLAGDVLLVQREIPGEVAAVAADPTEYRELARLPVFEGKVWNTPALAGDQLFLRNHEEMVCLQLNAR